VITLGGESKEGDVALKKASADLQALLRSAARLRGRPPELAEEAVRDARSWSAEEALDAKLIDLVVPSREALIEALDGREVVRPDGTRVTLALAGAPVVVHGMRWSENARNVVLHPTVLALLLSIAVLGIYVELTHPGLILPGAVGVIGLAVFLYGSSILPVRGFAALMLILGVLAFILEIKVTSYGLLGAAGTVLVALGLYLLFPRDIPGLAVPLMTLVPLVLVLVAALAAVTVLVARAHRAPVTTGREGLVGEEGESASTLDPEGTVLVHGEVWRARSPRPLPAGARVRVTGSRGLLLFVEPSGVPGGSASGVPDGSGSGVPDGSASGVSIGSASGVPDGSAVGPPVERRNG
jgi:membrane-bound serine protease (ClpP class)